MLLVEDNAGDARLIEEHLKEKGAGAFVLSARANCLDRALELIDSDSAEVVLLDLTLPESRGRETFEKLHRRAPHLPVIVLSSLDDQELALQLVHEGAQDYLVKSEINHALLTRTIRYAVERAHAEQQLSHERDLLYTLLDHMPDRIYFKDRQSRFIQASHSLAKLHHLANRADLLGKTDFDFFSQQHAQEAFDDEQRLMIEGEPIIDKLEEETWPDGHKTWALTSKLPLRDEHGRIIGTFGISRDVTYLKKIEAALAAERDLLHMLLDTVPDRIYFKDKKSRFLRVSRSLLKMHHFSGMDQIIGKTDFDLFTPEHAQPAFDDEQNVMRTGEPIVDKVEKETWADGRITWALTSKMPLRNDRGEIVGTFGLSRDITILKQIEDALAMERNLLSNLINNLPDRIFVKDTEGRYVIDNAAHWRFMGASSAEEMIGKKAEDFLPREVGERLTRADLELMASDRAVTNQEDSLAAADGTLRYHLATKVPLRDDRGKVTGLVCISRDVTEQKLAEIELKTANAKLSKALGDLRKAHDELRSVQMQLIEAEKLKSIGRLAAGVAHEVKNPLAIINMAVEFLSQETFPEGSSAPVVLEDIREAVRRADSVVRGLLDFSAPKSLNLQEENLNQVVLQSLRLVRGEMAKGKFQVIEELQPNLPLVQMDRAKIGQVFVNLFTNAVHAMGESGVLTARTYSKQLTGVGPNVADIRSESFRVGDTVVVAEVEDTGHGIPEDKLPKVFEPFYTTKPTGEGSGLGLSVVKTIIDLHGGTITMQNKPTGGVKVTVTFRA